MPMDSPLAEGFPASFRRWYHVLARSPLGRGWRRGLELELGQLSLGFAALGFLTLVPLLIIASSADQESGRGFAQWLEEGIGVSKASSKEVDELFLMPGRALKSTTAFGIAALVVFGLTFGTAVQSGYEKVWELPSAQWWASWRQLVWLSVLTVYVFASGTRLLREHAPGVFGASVSAIAFLWWSQHMLLGDRIRWRALLPGAVATVIGLLGLRVFSQLVFSPLIASNTLTYGPIGTVLVIQAWLVGVGGVVFGGALTGRLLHEELPRLAHAWEKARPRRPLK